MDAESKMGDPLDPDFYRCICEYDKARRNNAENFAEVKKYEGNSLHIEI